MCAWCDSLVTCDLWGGNEYGYEWIGVGFLTSSLVSVQLWWSDLHSGALGHTQWRTSCRSCNFVRSFPFRPLQFRFLGIWSFAFARRDGSWDPRSLGNSKPSFAASKEKEKASVSFVLNIALLHFWRWEFFVDRIEWFGNIRIWALQPRRALTCRSATSVLNLW